MKIRPYILPSEKKRQWRKKHALQFHPWQRYDFHHAKRMCKLKKTELVEWAVKELGWKKGEAQYLHVGQLRQMWCYKNNIEI